MKQSSTQPKFRHPKLSSRKKDHKQRQAIAVETARLMNEEGMDNIHSALQKVAHQLGIHDKHSLPDDSDIIFQIKIHQSLYQSSSHKQLLTKMRETALNTMKLLSTFKPKLIGPVLQGYAHKQSSIDLLLRADSPEEVAISLMSHEIPYQLKDWKLYFSQKKSQSKIKSQAQLVPTYQFYADMHKINLIVLTESLQKMTPLEPGNWQAMKKASLTQLESLLKEESEVT